MRVLVHMSDLHFGRVSARLLEPLIQAVGEIRPDLVAVSGDLTQRARRSEFRQARDFLRSLPAPQIIVPGNHDIPLHNPVLRLFHPLERFMNYITPDLFPLFADGELAVLGVNTARALVAHGGRINFEQVLEICRRFSGLLGEQARIIVTHHPFDLPAGFSNIHLVGRSRMAMENFARCGADLFLSGHLHKAYAGTTERYLIPGFSALVIEAGTVVSTRRRGELNSFNLICIERRLISLETHAWDPERGRFSSASTRHFRKTGAGWVPSE